MRKNMVRRIAALALLGLAVLTASCSHMARIKDDEEREIPQEVQAMQKVRINNTDQWIFLSGARADNPVVLWLDGGPGGSEVGWVRGYLGPLHANFTVVCWDQRGTAKSYHAVRDHKDLKVADYVQDVVELSSYLAQRFDQEKIYLVGHSWGSIIGLLAAKAHPELFHAYIGVAQHVNSIENDSIGWDMIHAGALAAGDTKVVKLLENQGKPPYATISADGTVVGDGDKYYNLLSRLYKYSPHAPADAGFDSMKMFLAPEHSWKDRVNLVKGLLKGVKIVYPQLAFLDFEKEAVKLELPVFIVNGRYDYTCVATITERWFNQLEAPVKDMLWLEHSGHNGVYTEPQAFISYMKEVVLPATRKN
jgi:pimeloyl-ACP methyl ester carboxylesterase